MEFLKDRRIVLALVGAAIALLAGLGIAAFLAGKNRGEPTEPPPASTGGLVVTTEGASNDDGVDPARPLRCFVAGQYVGEVTLAECAQKNGVATGALDVGVDESGALAAAGEAGTVLTPLPPTQDAAAVTAAPAAPVEPQVADAPSAPSGPAGPCWRYSGAEWRKVNGDQTLNSCVQTLFAGRCEKVGGATYGRWMQQTLRLVPGRVEVSGDNRSFRTLAEQGAGCSIPPVG